MPEEFSLTEVFRGHPRRAKLMFFLSGALLTLSFAPVGWYLLQPLLLLPLLYGFLVSSPRTAATYGFWFGAGLFLAGTYWFYISIHVFGQAPLILAMFLLLALVVIMGLYYAAAGWLTARLCDGEAMRLLLVAPSVWVAIEWLRGWFLSGFPWMSLGYGHIDSPLAGIAPVLGVYGIALVEMFSVAAVLVVVAGSVKQQLRWPLAASRLIALDCRISLAEYSMDRRSRPCGAHNDRAGWCFPGPEMAA